jgi:ribose transport system permease protein
MTSQTTTERDTPVKESGSPSILMRVLRVFQQSQLIGLVVFLVLLCVVISLAAPRFLDLYNIMTLTRQVSFVTLVALGQMMVLIGGAIDLSVGSTAGFCGIFAAWLMANTELNPWIALLLGIVAGALIGLLNGTLVTRLKLNAFVVTLSVGFVLNGIILVVTEGWAIQQIPQSITWLGQGTVGPLPVPTLITLVITVLLAFLLGRTYIGRHIYAVGGNDEAAALVGIRVARIRTLLFMISGSLAALAGVLMVARLASGQPTIGQTWMLPSFTAPLIGGTAMSGGVGSPFGTIIGAAIMGVLQNGLVMMNVSIYWEQVVIGGALALAILIDRFRARSRQA